jgi:hypothetical protein
MAGDAGPGWTKSGSYVPDPLLFRGAIFVARFFFVLAILVLIGGLIAVVSEGIALHHDGVSGVQAASVIIGIIGGTIIAAATIAFFGFVLELLVAIHFGLRFQDVMGSETGPLAHANISTRPHPQSSTPLSEKEVPERPAKVVVSLGSDPEIRHDMTHWSAEQRRDLARQLDEGRVSYFWRKATLVTYPKDEDAVEALFTRVCKSN